MSEEWISVEDRLPEIGVDVLVLEDDHDNPSDYYWHKVLKHYEGRKTPQRVKAAQVRNIDSEGYAYWQLDQYSSGHPVCPRENVTYWRPFPEVPQHLIKKLPE